jgi:hypothetical protein
LVESLALKQPELLKKLLVIDFNPVTLDELRARGVAGLFGDIGSMETLQHAHISHAKFIVSTIPDLLLKGIDNVGLVRICKAIAPHATIIATADDARHEQRLRAEGASAVVRVYEVAGDALAQTLIGATPAPPPHGCDRRAARGDARVGHHGSRGVIVTASRGPRPSRTASRTGSTRCRWRG